MTQENLGLSFGFQIFRKLYQKSCQYTANQFFHLTDNLITKSFSSQFFKKCLQKLVFNEITSKKLNSTNTTCK